MLSDEPLESMLAAHDAGPGKHSEILASFALKVRPDSVAPWIALLESQVAQGRTQRIITMAPIALKAFRDHPELLRFKGEALLAVGQFSAAEQSLRACLRRMPTNPVALQALDRLRTDRGDVDPSVRALVAAEPDPTTAAAQWRQDAPRAWLTEEKTPLTDSATCQRAIALAPAFAEAYEALAERIADDTEDTAAALKAVDRALALDHTGGATARQIKALVLVREGRVGAAIQVARAAVTLAPDNAQSHFVLAFALFNGLRDDAAAVLHARGRAIDPNHPAGHLTMNAWRDRGAEANFSWYFAS